MSFDQGTPGSCTGLGIGEPLRPEPVDRFRLSSPWAEPAADPNGGLEPGSHLLSLLGQGSVPEGGGVMAAISSNGSSAVP